MILSWQHLHNGWVIPVTLTDPLPPIVLSDCRNMMYSIFGISPVIICDVIVSAVSVTFGLPVSWYVIITMVTGGLFALDGLVQLSESCVVVVAVTMAPLGALGGTTN